MALIGMRGNGDWVDGQRPKNWRQAILRLYPNGDVPLTAIMSMMKSEKTDDPEFNWWSKTLATQAGAVTDVYTDALMSSAYATGGVAGQTLFVKVAAATAQQIRAGHQVLLINTANYLDSTNAKVTAVTVNGDSSRITVSLLQADPTTTGIADCNRILVVGNINPEGGTMPSAIAYDPTKLYNYTQIFRTPLSITRTARRTRLRTGDQYKEAKREALELHGIEMEKAWLFSVRTEGTGANGLPERTTGGIIAAANSYGTVSDFTTEASYSGKTWLEKGEEWIDTKLETIFRYGGKSRLALVGSGTILAINKLIKELGTYNISAQTAEYGIQVLTWVTPFGTINMKTHPLFSYEEAYRNSMLIIDPADLIYRYIDDTMFYGEGEKQNTGRNRVDGTDEEFLTEAGLEYHNPVKMGWLHGFGSDSAV